MPVEHRMVLAVFAKVVMVMAIVAAGVNTKKLRHNLGRSRMTGQKIIGGVDADINDHPHQLSFQYSGSHFCGASIISKSWALTAAHCCFRPAAGTSLRAGSATLEKGGTVYKVAERVVHARYAVSGDEADYDLCLLKVVKPFNFTKSVRPIALPSSGQVTNPGVDANVTGWGVTSSGGLANTLQVVSVPVVDADTCQDAYNTSAIVAQVTPRMICAGVKEGGIDSCQGDSGGPMVVAGQLVGVTSWGYGCALPAYYGVYAKVSEMRRWIKTITGL